MSAEAFVRAAIDGGDPNAPGGPRGWAPLLYVCPAGVGGAALARELLERGADPDASFTGEHGAMSALYGAAGVRPDPELTRVLLEVGADPDDGEEELHPTDHSADRSASTGREPSREQGGLCPLTRPVAGD